jgi:hypothetical protein
MNDVTIRSPFSVAQPGLQLSVDATSLNALDKCPRYYELSILRGLQAPIESDHLRFGTLYHAATELYDRLRAADLDHDQALPRVVEFLLHETWDPKLRRPWTSMEPTKTRSTLLRTTIWYLDTFRDDNLQTYILPSGKPAVELSFQLPLADLGFRTASGEPYELCGHIDKIVEWNSELWIVDKKTTKYALDDDYFHQFTPNNQISAYALAGQVILHKPVVGVIIDAAQILVNGSRFRRKPIGRTEPQLLEWLDDLRNKLCEAENYATAGRWPMRSTSCGFGKMQCTYRPVCSLDPAERKTWTDALFNVRPTWNPLEPR